MQINFIALDIRLAVSRREREKEDISFSKRLISKSSDEQTLHALFGTTWRVVLLVKPTRDPLGPACVTIDYCLINICENLLFAEAHMCGIIGREVIALSSGQHKLKRWNCLLNAVDSFLKLLRFISYFLQNHRSWRRISFLLSSDFRSATLTSWRCFRRCDSHRHVLRRNALSSWTSGLLSQQWKNSIRMSRFESSWCA